MSETGDDWAMKAAQVAFRGHAMDDYDDIIAATAAAVRQERERCARIADLRAATTKAGTIGRAECNAIAAAIRLTPRGE